MKLDDIKLSLYKYHFKSLEITVAGKKQEVEHSMILNFQMIENYDEEIFPFIAIKIGLPNNFYRKMIKPENKNNIIVNVDFQKAKFNETMAIEEQDVSFRSAIKCKFQGVIPPVEQDLTENEQEQVENDEEKDGYGQISATDMLLYPKDFYDNYQTVVNNNLAGVNLTDIMGYVLTCAGLNNLLISPSNNSKSYAEFTVTPLPADEQIGRLCDVYGFHKKGSIIHFSYDYGYIIDKVAACTAYYTNEYKNTYIVLTTENQGTREAGGSYSNGKEKYNVVNASEITADDSGDITEKTIGSNVISIDVDGNPTKQSSRGKKVTNVIIANEGNQTPEMITRAQKEAQQGVSVQFNNIDITMMRPNKQFIVSVEGTKYKKYNGKYRLRKIAHMFEKEGDYFSVTSIANLVIG